MNLIQVNHENMIPQAVATEVHVVQAPNELGLSKEEILNKYTDPMYFKD